MDEGGPSVAELGIKEDPEQPSISIKIHTINPEVEQAKNEFGQVETLSATENVYFVHSINTNIVGGQFNDAIQETATFEDKLAVAVITEPTLPCSSIREGKHKLWGEIGVILRKGRIEDANTNDSGSRVNDVGLRTYSNHSDADTYRSKVLEAIRNPMGSPSLYVYNEITISHPQIAGMYINIDQPRLKISNGVVDPNEIVRWPRSSDDDLYNYPLKDIFDIADEYGMKLFAFQNGIAHKTALSDQGEFEVGEEVSPQQMLEQKFEIPEENKAKITQRARNTLKRDPSIQLNP